MKAAIVVSNTGSGIFEGTELQIKVDEIKTDRLMSVRQIAVGELPAQDSFLLQIDFSDIRVYGTFAVTIRVEGIKYETKIARIPPARRRAYKVGVNTQLSMARQEAMKIVFGLLSKSVSDGCSTMSSGNSALRLRTGLPSRRRISIASI